MIEESIETFKYDENQKKNIVESLQDLQKEGPLIDVRYLRTGLGEKIITLVKDILYSSKNNNSKLIDSIANMCIESNGIKSIITYNFDDLIEKKLLDLNLPFNSIVGDNYEKNRSTISIYHVHGYLPEKDTNSSNIVFSEESYHNVFTNPFTWSNIVQLNMLTETTCLFIRCSLRDPNLRRLLEISSKKNKDAKHYVILERIKYEKVDLLESVNDYLTVHHSILEKSYLELGLNTIWVNDHNDIPNLINKISSTI